MFSFAFAVVFVSSLGKLNVISELVLATILQHFINVKFSSLDVELSAIET